VPDDITDDARRWFLFLQEGGWDHDRGFQVEMLSPSERVELENLLAEEYGEDLASPAQSCLQVLKTMPH
jgi:hypothetical protein